MEATIKVSMDNAAFAETPATELGRILRDLAEEVENGCTGKALHDLNGNTVGRFELSE